MQKCKQCKHTILFGGYNKYNFKFCNKNCYNNFYSEYIISIANELPNDIIEQAYKEILFSECPRCGQIDKLNCYTYYVIYSFFIISSFNNYSIVCCQHCGRKNNIKYIILSLIFGWWSLPWGLIMTPIQIIKNINAITKPPNEKNKEILLKQFVRIQIAVDKFEHYKKI